MTEVFNQLYKHSSFSTKSNQIIATTIYNFYLKILLINKLKWLLSDQFKLNTEFCKTRPPLICLQLNVRTYQFGPSNQSTSLGCPQTLALIDWTFYCFFPLDLWTNFSSFNFRTSSLKIDLSMLWIEQIWIIQLQVIYSIVFIY